MSSRLDRVYVSRILVGCLASCDTRAVSFSDHLAVVCTLRSDQPCRPERRPPSAWSLDSSILTEEAFTNTFKQQWQQWCALRPRYSNAVDWWLRLVKPAIRGVAAAYTRERRRERSAMLQFLQQALQEVCAKDHRTPEDINTIKELKSAIIAIHGERLRGVTVSSKVDSTLDEEPTSMHQVYKCRQRSKQQNIDHMTTDDGEVLDTQDTIADHLLEVFRDKFGAPPGPPPPPASLLHLDAAVTEEDNELLSRDVTEAEVLARRPLQQEAQESRP